MGKVQQIINEIEERFVGTLLGTAIGDALGNPVEGYSPQMIKHKHGIVEDYDHNWDPPGTYTDDTQLTLITAESLLEEKGFVLDDLAQRFIDWLPESTSPGMGTQGAIIDLKQGISPYNSGQDSAGNGAAMRVAPLALVYHSPKDHNTLRQYVEEASRMTHADPRAVAGAWAVARSIAYLLNRHADFELGSYVDTIAEDAGQFSPELGDKIASLPSLLAQPDLVAEEHIGTGSFVMESVPFAIYCFLKSPQDPEATIIRAVNAGGDTDTNASIAGSLSGALNGMQFPEHWREGLQREKGADYIQQVASSLYHLYQTLRK